MRNKHLRTWEHVKKPQQGALKWSREEYSRNNRRKAERNLWKCSLTSGGRRQVRQKALWEWSVNGCKKKGLNISRKRWSVIYEWRKRSRDHSWPSASGQVTDVWKQRQHVWRCSCERDDQAVVFGEDLPQYEVFSGTTPSSWNIVKLISYGN